MGIRITLPVDVPNSNITGNTIADNYIGGLRPLQGSIDSIGNLGSLTQSTLSSAQAAVDAAALLPMQNREDLIAIHTTSLNSNLGIAIKSSPPRATAQLSNITNNVSRMSSSATQAFNSAKEIVTSTKGLITLSLITLCLLLASSIQRCIAKLVATALRMQRTILAKIDAIRQQVIDLVQSAIDAAMEVLPDCNQIIKEVTQELRSILGKASTMVAAVNRLIREVAPCTNLGQSIIGAASNPGSLWSITNKSKNITDYDMYTLKKEYREGIKESKDEITNNRDWYLNNNLIWDSTVGRLVEAKKEAEDAKNSIEDLIEDSKNNGNDDPKYQEALENAKKDLEDLLEDLQDAEDNLMDETLDIIDNMTNTATDSLDDLEQNLNDEMDEITNTVEDIFKGLENIADEFESPEVQENLVTACAENEVRKVLQNEE